MSSRISNLQLPPNERKASIPQSTHELPDPNSPTADQGSDRASATGSPISKLPGELLLMIFQYHQRQKVTYNRDDPSFVKYRGTIASTCAAWRGLALGISTWWNILVYDGSQRSGEMCGLYMERAGHSNIYLGVENGREWDDDVAKDWMKIHANSLARCNHLNIRLFNSSRFQLPVPLPALRRYECTTDGFSNSSIPGSHPSLERITLSNVRNSYFPWAPLGDACGLTHLEIYLPCAGTPMGLAPFLTSCHDLKFLALTLGGPGIFGDELRVTLPSLESLQVYGSAFEIFGRYVSAPQLKRLRLDTQSMRGDFGPALRTFPSLEHLETPLSPYITTAPLLELIPRLSILRLIRVSETDLHSFLEIVNSLTELATSYTLHPPNNKSWFRLRSFEISLRLRRDIWDALRSGLLLAIKSMHRILEIASSGEAFQTRVEISIKHMDNSLTDPTTSELPHHDVLVYGALPQHEVWNVWDECS
ncbi:uncharacterized protein EI90DRAFT_1316628 [Cantharellus anzutake]|uniref:uncharacterized protein n=1 Tax=Cantharellus anzutake TaxID=1750568 RepID=UPI001908F727|nr:uncharacterized protein EI90DRAFT_1316628 [Cantharellus anzutake]KAF8342224.1 hypothetical protein EI90DRAFT_1316628 [Cantharellus anzutake]